MAYMENEPDLKELRQMILKKINEMGFFEKIWRQNKFIVIIAVVLIVVILVVLNIAFTPSAPEQEAPVPQEKAPVEVVLEKTAAAEVEGTVLEGEIAGTVTVLVRGEDKGTFNLTSEGVIVGRDPSTVNVHISDNLVSKNHVKILPRGDQFYLVDLGSTNGTYVNGEKIKESQVSPDDMVQLGKKGDIKLILKK
jgi:pSer/pThr/pTyr-binding forkhead associated (FHA) protein